MFLDIGATQVLVGLLLLHCSTAFARILGATGRRRGQGWQQPVVSPFQGGRSEQVAHFSSKRAPREPRTGA